MTYVLLGNPAAVEAYRDAASDDPDKVRYRRISGKRVTEVRIPDGTSLGHAMATVLDVHQHHFADENQAPAWIESDSDGLSALLLDHFSRAPYLPQDAEAAKKFKIGKRMPKGWGLEADETWELADALRTNGGRDWQARVMGDSASTGTGNYAAAYFIGLTANNTAPVAGNTTLTGEIAAGTLARGAATYAHTNGTATYTLTRTVTSDQAVTINKMGVFTALAGGVLVFETVLNAPAVLANLDQCTFTETVTL